LALQEAQLEAGKAPRLDLAEALIGLSLKSGFCPSLKNKRATRTSLPPCPDARAEDHLLYIEMDGEI
jgi:hypothetical protein